LKLSDHCTLLQWDLPFKFKEGDEILYGVGIVMEKPMPDRFKGRFDILPFEASTWLVFSAMDNTRDSSLPGTQELYARIGEWLPTSEYEETGAPTITWYESYDFSKPDKKSEIWVPVRKRNGPSS
jgi:AraC family transcriptional regulator